MSEAGGLMPGAEPFSAEGGPHGALVLHGFTGNPSSMRPVADAFAEAGWSVELPRLPGHGTTVDDMLDTSWDDWSTCVEATYADLASRCEQVFVTGLSMGGTLTAWLAARHPEVAGIACINPAVAPRDPAERRMVVDMIAAGERTMPGIGSDIAAEGVVESAYAETPLPPLLGLFDAVDELQAGLADIACPVLILTSPEDHVVPPADSDHLAAGVTGPVERVSLDRSYHVATLDHDAPMLIERILEFAGRAVP